jgi:hypothetical protein
VASILSQAEELQAWERLEFENQGVPSDQAGRDAWDEWDEPGEVLPDDEDGLGGPWEISAIHNRLYGLADERLYYTAAATAIGVAALLPALVSLPLLFFFRGDLSDDDGGPSDKTWRGSGGSGIWSCCIPWHPSFYVVVANVIPAGLLAIHLRSKVPYSNQIHQLSLRRAKHRTSGLGCISGTVQSTWVMLALLLAITNLTNLIKFIATSVSVAVLHAIIIIENYCILAAVRKTANFLFRHEVPLVRERQMFLQLWAAGTANTLLGLLLPPLLTTMYGPLSWRAVYRSMHFREVLKSRRLACLF